ncbi:MAG: UDP-3-O-(3-hydroxymyristoyl)glucosamine N-acyltransferase [Bacteriovoracaceae bacterium]|nr:UDP-3-O-(3-hydroxymyristoyl)glucosamine N-acyltransferase [Bacteriovoracaceae bacterium]
MKLNELKKYDSSINLVYPDFWDSKISGISTTESPMANHIVFIREKKFLENFLEKLRSGNINSSNIVLIEEKFWNCLQEDNGTLLKDMKRVLSMIATVKDVNLSMSRLSRPYYEKMVDDFDDIVDGRKTETARIHPETKIAPNVFIGKNVVIERGAIINSGCVILSNSKIGEDTILYPNVSIYQNVKIGKNCRLHSGVVIGSDGFGYNFDGTKHVKVWHMGGAILENNVEIGSCSCIDGGTFSPTIIGNGSKIDNGVQIGHNCFIGKGVILCGHVGLSGSCTVGHYTVMGGKSGMGPGVTIGDSCQVAGGALVSKDWPSKSVVAGHPARSINDWFRANAFIQNQIKKKKKTIKGS